MNDLDFVNDPIFKSLRKFASSDDSEKSMPPQVREGFRNGARSARKRRHAWRGAFGAGLIIIAFPTLATANILPHPIQHFVESVNRVITSPIHKLINLGTVRSPLHHQGAKTGLVKSPKGEAASKNKGKASKSLHHGNLNKGVGKAHHQKIHTSKGKKATHQSKARHTFKGNPHKGA